MGINLNHKNTNKQNNTPKTSIQKKAEKENKEQLRQKRK